MTYYNLNQLLTNNLTDLKLRQLKNRVKQVSKLITDTNLITKVGNRWKIHKSIVNHFKSTWVNRKEFRTEITVNLDGSYDKQYYTQIAKEIATLEPKAKLKYSIESNYNNKFHIHLATSLTVKQSKRVLQKIDRIRDNIIMLNHNTHIAPIIDLKVYIDYISKEVVPVEVLN